MKILNTTGKIIMMSACQSMLYLATTARHVPLNLCLEVTHLQYTELCALLIVRLEKFSNRKHQPVR